MAGISFASEDQTNIDPVSIYQSFIEEDLKAKMESGKNMEQIVTECGLTMEQFHEKILELRKAEISQALENGEITQEQVAKMLERLEKGPRGQERPGNNSAEKPGNRQ
ncbi:MAG: hypothetical protein RJR37_00590 [Peptococcaceae bacterium MAG4]|nr:hypothetical protein [Peptococcaceae bacterium MAG4]